MSTDKTLSFYARGQQLTVVAKPLSETRLPRALAFRAASTGDRPFEPEPLTTRLSETLKQSTFLQERVDTDDVGGLLVLTPTRRDARSQATTMIATSTLIVEGARIADLEAARSRGAELVHEGLDGKALLRCASVEKAFGIAKLLLERNVGTATPNFLRVRRKLTPSKPVAAWAHKKVGLAKAHAITRGRKEIAVAILDEGVDGSHPDLKSRLIAEKDFIGTNGASAMPSGDDAHGTACAGIAVGAGRRALGIAPGCSLIAARIAMGNAQGDWIFDDYAAADAIDWCWREGAAVLSNSWGGGLPSDAISRALGRARTQGRGGLGSIVVIAAGNDEAPIDFPGNLPGYVTVGASTPRDERKTHKSSDGEDWWGSNYGQTIALVAPGVFIHTTDIRGAAGYDATDYTKTFNGTSSATPHVAGAAALILSANPTLSATEVRTILQNTAHPIEKQVGWDTQRGWGRLDVAKAVGVARKEAEEEKKSSTGKAKKKKAKKKTPA